VVHRHCGDVPYEIRCVDLTFTAAVPIVVKLSSSVSASGTKGTLPSHRLASARRLPFMRVLNANAEIQSLAIVTGSPCSISSMELE
jgi:hypothetical protein